jgi:hypothetical protein
MGGERARPLSGLDAAKVGIKNETTKKNDENFCTAKMPLKHFSPNFIRSF